MDIKQKIKEVGVRINTRVAKSIMDLFDRGYSKTGTSAFTRPFRTKERWTEETAIVSSLLWPNLIEFGNEARRWGEFVRVTDKLNCAKRLIDKNIRIIKFGCVYANVHWNQCGPSAVNVVVKSKEKDVIDDAKELATLILNRELGDLEPFIICGDITGRIRLSDGVVEYSMLRDIHLSVSNIMTEIDYLIEGYEKINIMESIKDIVLNDLDKEDSWQSINFEYNKDIIADEEVINDIKKEMFEKIHKQVKTRKAIFRGFKVSHIGRVEHYLRPHWADLPSYRFFKMIITISFERKFEDVRYGVLFKF
jgi:hypothetical protein